MSQFVNRDPLQASLMDLLGARFGLGGGRTDPSTADLSRGQQLLSLLEPLKGGVVFDEPTDMTGQWGAPTDTEEVRYTNSTLGALQLNENGEVVLTLTDCLQHWRDGSQHRTSDYSYLLPGEVVLGKINSGDTIVRLNSERQLRIRPPTRPTS